MNNFQLKTTQIEALFRFDVQGRLTSTNESGDPPAPRFYMGRTAQGNQWRFDRGLPGELVQELERLCAAEPVVAELERLPTQYAAIRAVLEAHAPIIEEYRGPCYSFPPVIEPQPGAVLIDATNNFLLQQTFPWCAPFPELEGTHVVAAAIADQKAVAICFDSRYTAQAAEAGVETLEAYRGHGYASRAVAVWAAEIRRLGRTPLYSTSWENSASRAVARKLGLIQYGEDWSIS